MPNHYGYESSKTIDLDFYLVVKRERGGMRRPTVKAVAGYPSMNRDERAINLKIKLPLALFETPSLSASIVVAEPEQAVHIEATALAAAVRQVTGLDVDIKVVEP